MIKGRQDSAHAVRAHPGMAIPAVTVKGPTSFNRPLRIIRDYIVGNTRVDRQRVSILLIHWIYW